MRLLSLETSSERGSVALWRDGWLGERVSDAREAHSERVLPQVRELLEEAGLRLAELDAIAYGAGPGAFTGLRLACGVAQGLAFGAGLPVVGVGSLEALAWATGRERCYVAVYARMNEVYFAAYRVAANSIETVIEPGVAAPAAVPPPPGWGWHGCGSGFAAYGEVLRTRLGAALAAVDGDALPGAAAVARLAALRLEQHGGVDPALAQPLYVRDKVALTTAERHARGGKA